MKMKKSRQDLFWRSHTRTNIGRLRGIFEQQSTPHIFETDPQKKFKQQQSIESSRRAYYRLALDITLTELVPNKRFPWGKFQNILRILVAGAAIHYDEKQLFEQGSNFEDEDEK